MNDKYKYYIGKFFVMIKFHRFHGTEWSSDEELMVDEIREFNRNITIRTKWAEPTKPYRNTANLHVRNLNEFREVTRRMYKNEGKRFKESLK